MGQQDYTIIKNSLFLTFKLVEVQGKKAFKAWSNAEKSTMVHGCKTKTDVTGIVGFMW